MFFSLCLYGLITFLSLLFIWPCVCMNIFFLGMWILFFLLLTNAFLEPDQCSPNWTISASTTPLFYEHLPLRTLPTSMCHHDDLTTNIHHDLRPLTITLVGVGNIFLFSPPLSNILVTPLQTLNYSALCHHHLTFSSHLNLCLFRGHRGSSNWSMPLSSLLLFSLAAFHGNNCAFGNCHQWCVCVCISVIVSLHCPVFLPFLPRAIVVLVMCGGGVADGGGGVLLVGVVHCWRWEIFQFDSAMLSTVVVWPVTAASPVALTVAYMQDAAWWHE